MLNLIKRILSRSFRRGYKFGYNEGTTPYSLLVGSPEADATGDQSWWAGRIAGYEAGYCARNRPSPHMDYAGQLLTPAPREAGGEPVIRN